MDYNVARNRTLYIHHDQFLPQIEYYIAQLKRSVASAEDAISENTNIVNQASEDLQVANRDYDETLQALAQGTAQRDQEHTAWSDEDFELSSQIVTL